jgi:UDP-glucose 4-epimerase
MKILLIGHKGLIGESIKNSLINHKVEFVNYNRLKKNHSINYNINLFKQEYSEGTFDVCINCAGQSKVWYSWKNPIEDIESNLILHIELMRSNLVKKNGRFIYFGSDSIFGNITPLNSYDNKIDLNSPYAISKFAGEKYTSIYANKLSYNYSILRPSFVVGKLFSRNILYDSIVAFYNSEKFPQLHPDSKFNFIDVDDLADYIIKSMLKGILEEIQHVSSINSTSYSEILNYFGEDLSKYINFKKINRALVNDSNYKKYFDLNKFITSFRYVKD